LQNVSSRRRSRDPQVRKYVAQKLKLSAKKGNTTLGGLNAVAHGALQDLSKPKSA
jgi:hypothetical protein